jgi:alpha-L-rhamnosidase
MNHKQSFPTMNRILSSILITFILLPLQAKMRIVNPTTNYQVNPLGIDTTPVFSWQMQSDRPNTMQTAYRIVVASSAENLARHQYVFDTGKVPDSHSVAIPYQGAMHSATRYYWQVTVWDNHGHRLASQPSWFETGLLKRDDWGKPQWIGSSKVQLSPLRSNFVADYDAEDGATFFFGRQDSAHYCAVTLHDGFLEVTHRHGGEVVRDVRESIAHLLKPGRQHVRLNVFSAQYCRTYRFDVYVNDSMVHRSTPDTVNIPRTLEQKLTLGRLATFEIIPEPGNKQFRECRLYQFGGTAGIHNLRLTHPVWHTLLYSDGEDLTTTSAPLLRRSFILSKPIRSARLYATARGIYEFHINGHRVGRDFLAPGWPDYRNRLFYSTYDVTSLLRQGDNTIGAMLGNGWWCGYNGYQTDWQDQYGVSPSLMALLRITYTDGTVSTVTTDGSWLCYDRGPVGFNSLQNGETYDATREVKHWSEPRLDTAGWTPVHVFESPADSIRLQCYVGGAVEARDTLKALRQTEPLPQTYIYDMGQNMAGIPSIRICGKRGQRITIKYGEMLWPQQIPTTPVAPYTREMYEQRRGQLYTDNYRSALSTDTFVCKGGWETFEPRFTYHGFRYIQLEGLDRPLPLGNVKALVLHSMDGPQTSHLETSDTLVNQLFSNIVWGQRSNFLAVPTDCPQRDERLGYTGDGQIFALSATYNYNVEPFMRRWLMSVRDNQDAEGNFPDYAPKVGQPRSNTRGGGSTGWSDAGVIVPWLLCEQYADRQTLEESYPSMRKYMDWMEQRAVDSLQPAGGLGDWLAFEQSNDQMTNTAYYAYDALIMAQAALALGKNADAEHYTQLHAGIKRAFNRTFVLPDGRTYTPRGYKKGLFFPVTLDHDSIEDTQSSYVLPLKASLFQHPDVAARRLAQAVIRRGGHLSTGFIGTPWLAPMLTSNGQGDVAWRLFLNRTYPSWLYPVTQGATTIWERWNSYTREQGFGPVRMNSFNHYSYGAVEEWIMQEALGIKPDATEPGYKHFFVEPSVSAAIGKVSGWFDSMYGRIAVEWTCDDQKATCRVTVPANTSASFSLGDKHKELTSGTYLFNVPIDSIKSGNH